ncbi:MAG TPA: hypothetical protein VKT82_34235 [Ktedonobacterales bacterium]|nr:hypothetical protein [Ktedonobacterales bacterium]
MAESYAEAYARCCAGTVERVQKRLGRDLTAREQRRIWNSGSLMMLEMVDRGLTEVPSTAAIEQELREMEKWTEERFQMALAKLLELLPAWLGRAITDVEREALAQSEHLGVFMNLTERLPKAQPDQRETLLRAATGMDAGPGTLPSG